MFLTLVATEQSDFLQSDRADVQVISYPDSIQKQQAQVFRPAPASVSELHNVTKDVFAQVRNDGEPSNEATLPEGWSYTSLPAWDLHISIPPEGYQSEKENAEDIQYKRWSEYRQDSLSRNLAIQGDGYQLGLINAVWMEDIGGFIGAGGMFSRGYSLIVL